MTLWHRHMLCALVAIAAPYAVMAQQAPITPSAAARGFTPSIVPQPDQVSDYEARMTLVQMLSDTVDGSTKALEHIEELLKEKPNDFKLRLLYAKALLQLRQYDKAIAEANKLLAVDLSDATLLSQLAMLQADLGYFLTAQQLMERAIELSECHNNALLISYAGTMLRWGEYAHAEEIYNAILAQDPQNTEVCTRLAEALMGEQRLFEAEQLYWQMYESKPKPELLLAIANIRFQLHDYCAALELLEDLQLEGARHNEPALLRARSIEKAGDPLTAAELYEEIAKAEKSSSFACLLLLKAYKALQSACEMEHAEELLNQAIKTCPDLPAVRFYQSFASETFPNQLDEIIAKATTAQELLAWGALYISEGLVSSAIEIYRAAAAIDSAYTPAKIELASLLSTELRYDAATDVYQDLRHDFPDSNQYLLEYARVLSWNKHYTASLCIYNQIVEEYPWNPVPLLERARVALWWQHGDLSMYYYQQLIDSPEIDLRGLCDVRTACSLEMRAQEAMWNKHYLSALCYFQDWLEFLPGSEEALFGYSELLCSLGMRGQAECINERIHDIDPLHTLVNLAMERRAILLRPAAVGLYEYWHEVGRGELSGIWRHHLAWGVDYPLDYQSSLRVIQDTFANYTLINKHTFLSEGLTAEYQRTFSPQLSLFASITEKAWANYHLKDHWLGTIRLSGQLTDCFVYTVGCARKNEYYNYFGVLHDLTSTSVWAKGNVEVNRKLFVEGNYQYLSYNDNNNQSIVQLGSSYQLTEFPCILRVILQAEYRNTAHPSVFVYNNNDLVNIIHPYWSPQNYWAGRGGLEWYHDLAFLSFCGAERNSYALRIIWGDDTENNPGTAFNFDWNFDWNDCWSLTLSGALYRTRQWDAEGIWSNLSYRF